MSPTVLRYKRFWLEPIISLANSTGLNAKQLNELQKLIESKKDEISRAWDKHFKT